MLEIIKILLATELGRNSERALEYAKLFTSQFHAELHVLHVLENIPSTTPTFGGGLATTTYVHESPEIAEQKIHALFEPAWLIGKKTVFATVDGSPAVEILRYAEERTIDLIILGTHGRSGLAHIWLGSVAEQVTRQSKCPVTIVRSL
jgi:universal stress protein A